MQKYRYENAENVSYFLKLNVGMMFYSDLFPVFVSFFAKLAWSILSIKSKDHQFDNFNFIATVG